MIRRYCAPRGVVKNLGCRERHFTTLISFTSLQWHQGKILSWSNRMKNDN